MARPIELSTAELLEIEYVLEENKSEKLSVPGSRLWRLFQDRPCVREALGASEKTRKRIEQFDSRRLKSDVNLSGSFGHGYRFSHHHRFSLPRS